MAKAQQDEFDRIITDAPQTLTPAAADRPGRKIVRRLPKTGSSGLAQMMKQGGVRAG